jgi:hypothetical protein
MIQIALGETGAWTIIDGLSVAAPFKNAVCYFEQSDKDQVTDKIEIFLKGTPAQISDGVRTIEQIILRSYLNDQGHYPTPQYLRFQLESGGDYYYAEFQNPYLTTNAQGYSTHYKGSIMLNLIYKRSNSFYGDLEPLPLTGRNGTDLTTGIDISNHTDYHAIDGSSIYIKPTDLTSPLPSPLRVELENTYATDKLKDIFIGIYQHPTNDDEDTFFHNAPDLSGGSLLMNLNAINDYYRRLTWSTTTWTALCSVTLTLDLVDELAGHSYRPFIHLLNSHVYPDLFLKFHFQRGIYTVYSSESIYADPDYDYLFFPPMPIPPNRVLRETLPHSLDLVLYAFKPTTGTYTLDIDQLQLFPLDGAANFLGFFNMTQDDKFIYDAFRGLHNVRYSAAGSETVSHVLQGAPLMAQPGVYNRLFFIMANQNNTVDIARTANIKVSHRKRLRVL